MRPYRYPKKLRPDVDFTTLRRNLSYITTLIFLRRHVISRTLEEKKSLANTRVARDSHYPLIYLYLKDLLKIGGRQLETVYNKAVWLHLHVQYIALNLCI